MKTRHMHFVVDEETYQEVRRRAFAARLSIGEYLRRCLGISPKPTEERGSHRSGGEDFA